MPSNSSRASSTAAAGGGNAVYGLGWIGALVFYLQQADAWWEYLLAFLKSIVWPAFLVFDVLSKVSV
jgi:hypothetical protein